MGRILALDVGRKRTGVATTDPLRIIATAVGYFPTHQIAEWVVAYAQNEEVDLVVVGYPKQADNSESESMRFIQPVINRLRKLMPDMELVQYDERYTSVMAKRTILESGIGRMARREKGLVDEVSAVILLQGFMESKLYAEEYRDKR